MNAPVTHTECGKHRQDVEELIERRVREADERRRTEIAEVKADIKKIYDKIDSIKWYLLGLIIAILFAAVKVGGL